MITVKRAYDRMSAADGTRFLVERLWPRGVHKATLRIDGWLKDVAPSTELRKWFNHDPGRWDEFRRRYCRELDSEPDAWRPIVSAARRGRVTLVYSSHDTDHNNAVALQEYLQRKVRRSAIPRKERHRRSVVLSLALTLLLAGGAASLHAQPPFASADAVRDLTVRLTDTNGPKGGVDSRCAITLHRLDGRRIVTEATTAWPFASVTSAAKRLKAAVRREIERTRVSARRGGKRSRPDSRAPA
jgi:uncharacterized protein YeaO (DUF488 family)